MQRDNNNNNNKKGEGKKYFKELEFDTSVLKLTG